MCRTRSIASLAGCSYSANQASTSGFVFIGSTVSGGWSDCSFGVELRSYALVDFSQDPAPMVLLLVVDDPASLAETERLALEGLDVGIHPGSG